LAAAEPAAAKTLEMEPTSPWNLHYDSDSCVLRRAFGEGEQRTQLDMRRFQPGVGLQTTIATKAMRMTQRDFRYRFDPKIEWQDAAMANYVHFAEDFEGVIFTPLLIDLPFGKKPDAKEVEQFLKTADLEALEAEAGDRVQSITISRAFWDDLVLKTGSLKAPLSALNTCIDELLNHWGIDVEAHKTLTRPATPRNVEEMGRRIPYPPKMLARRLPGIVNVRLNVDESGAVSGCHIQMELSDPAFESATCNTLLKALKFDPALDKNGNPIASYWINRVYFRL
jgi:hypothetical protein